MDKDIRNMSNVEMWEQFIQFVADKNQPMSDGDWCEEALHFADGDVNVATSLLTMTKKAELFYKMARNDLD
jgi:hypothetical protein